MESGLIKKWSGWLRRNIVGDLEIFVRTGPWKKRREVV